MHIEQLLHGYNNGHHLIAGSVSLPLQDADLMSYLSDWSGYVNPVDKDTSYLTAYPLAESHSYVIAKSWYADEMSRPGCVWTHSLVVKLDTLGQYTNFYDLLKLFKRPEREGDDFLSYTKPIELKDEKRQEQRGLLSYVDPTRFMFLAAMLLDRQKPAVYVVEKSSETYIEICMRLIQNIPFGILNELVICSGTASPRKFGKGFYNLQFVVSKGDSLMELYPDSTSKPTADKGFQFWLDAVLSGRNDIAQMMHLFSGDIGNDASRFLAVTNLLKLLNDRIITDPKPVSYSEVLNYLTSAFPDKDSGSAIKKAYLGENVSKLFCDERTFIIELATTQKADALDYHAIGFSDRVENYRKSKAIEDYEALLMELSKADYLNAEGKSLLSNALDGLSEDEMVGLLGQNWFLFKSIVTMNHDVLTQSFWLELLPPQFISLFSIFQSNVPDGFDSWEKLYLKLLTIDTFVADNVLSAFESNVNDYVSIAMNQWNERIKTPMNKAILNLCMKRHSKVIKWMGSQAYINDDLRLVIKRSINPDDTAVVNMGSAIWKPFVESELNSQVGANELVYVYVLAFNWHDYNALGYIKSVLPFIYDALSTESLSYLAWKKIEKFTGSVPFWRSWDNCRKVLIGVKDYCKRMNLRDDEMVNFTTNKKLNEELLDLWKRG